MSLDLRQSARLADLIEGAIAAAVKSYVRSRDEQLRRQEAEHIGFITHELRNPLSTATLGAIQLRRMVAISPEQSRLLTLVERSLRRLGDLITGVLLVERDTHELAPERKALTVEELLEEPLTGARLAAGAKGIQLDARFDPE